MNELVYGQFFAGKLLETASQTNSQLNYKDVFHSISIISPPAGEK